MMPARGSRSRAIALVLIALVFVAGGAAGVVVDRLLISRTVVGTRVTADMSEVLDELQLTPRQRAQAEAMLQRRAPNAEAVMHEVAERLRSVSDSLDAELRTILTSEQRAKLDLMRRRPLFVIKRKTSARGVTVDTLR